MSIYKVNLVVQALKDIINAASAGEPYTIEELLGGDFREAINAMSELEEELKK
mgnify:CR=1 FL=1